MVQVKKLALLGACLLLIDQLSKYLAQQIPFQSLTYNNGIALGLLPGTNTFMILVSIIAIGAVVYSIPKSKAIEQYLLTIVLAGIVGNGVDRVIHGAVIDFISIPFFAPIFNFADVYITTGVAALIAWPLIQNSSRSSSSSK